jgi:gliding motility-associated-like protein
LDAGSWKEVTWRTDDDIVLGHGEILNFQPQEKSTISVIVIGHNNCVSVDTIEVSLLSLPSFDLGPSHTYCVGDEVTLSANVEANSTWTDQDRNVVSNSDVYRFLATETKRLFLSVEDEDGCTKKDSVDVMVNRLPDLDLAGDNKICFGSVAVLGIKEQSFQSIIWETNHDGFLASDTWIVEQPILVSTNVIATLIDLNGCAQSDSLYVDVYSLPTALAGRDTLLCYGEQTILGVANYPEQGSLSFHWSPSLYLTNTDVPSPITAPEESMHYSLTVTDDNGCSKTDSVYIEINPQVTVDAGGELEACIGSPIELGGNPTASGSRFPYSFEWISEDGSIVGTSANPEFYPEASGQFYAFVTTGRCEIFIDSVSVIVYSRPDITVTPGHSIGSGSSVQLHVSGATQYLWTPAATLDEPTSSDPFASPSVNTRYFVQGFDDNGCSDTTSVMVLVQNSIFIPSLFTPNGDGSNDHFKLYGSGVKKISLTIFDQSGAEIFYAEDFDLIFRVGWDGFHKGSALSDDIYIWVINGEYDDGTPVKFNGHNRGIIKLMK